MKIAMIGAAIAWMINALLREVVLNPIPITAPHSDHMMNPCNKMTSVVRVKEVKLFFLQRFNP